MAIFRSFEDTQRIEEVRKETNNPKCLMYHISRLTDAVLCGKDEHRPDRTVRPKRKVRSVLDEGEE
jgi:hypothetical protein